MNNKEGLEKIEESKKLDSTITTKEDLDEQRAEWEGMGTTQISEEELIERLKEDLTNDK